MVIGPRWTTITQDGIQRLSIPEDDVPGHVRYLRVLTLNHPAGRKAALPGMKNILAALSKRDPARAAEVMAEHLRVAREHLRIVLEEIAHETADGPAPPAAR